MYAHLFYCDKKISLRRIKTSILCISFLLGYWYDYEQSGPCFNIKTVLSLTWGSYAGKTTSLYWDGPLVPCSMYSNHLCNEGWNPIYVCCFFNLDSAKFSKTANYHLVLRHSQDQQWFGWVRTLVNRGQFSLLFNEQTSEHTLSDFQRMDIWLIGG